MKKLLTVIIFVLVISSLFIQNIKASDTEEIINSYTCGDDTRVVIYQITEVNFDYTFNTLLIRLNDSALNISFNYNQMFHIWDLGIEIDNRPYKFFASPEIEDNDGNFFFSYPLNSLNQTKMIKITYFMDNVKQQFPDFLYPFDYYILSQPNHNESVYRGMAISRKIIFPYGLINGTVEKQYDLNLKLNKHSIDSSIRTRIFGTDSIKVIPETGRRNEGQVCNLNFVYYNPANSQVIPLELNWMESQTKIGFGRNNLVIFIFLVLSVYLIMVTWYYIKKEYLLSERLYSTYVKASIIPWFFSQFTISILPEIRRPYSFTVFDFIILFPLIMIFFHYKILERR